MQRGQEEVSESDDIHYGFRPMPSVLSVQRDRRLKEERAEDMVSHAEETGERRGVRQVIPSAGSRLSRAVPSGRYENYHQDSPRINWCSFVFPCWTGSSKTFCLRRLQVGPHHAGTRSGNTCGAQFEKPVALCGTRRGTSSSTTSTPSTWFAGDASIV